MIRGNCERPLRVCVTGGIGSGKTTAVRFFAGLGAPVYDSDARAKCLMEGDAALRERLVARFGPEIYVCSPSGTQSHPCLNRRLLAARVFDDPHELAALDTLVHPVVTADFRRWAAAQTADYIILETALLFESGLDREVDVIIAITAPRALRLERTQLRDGLTREQIERRMAAQLPDDERLARADFAIDNTDLRHLEAEVIRLDKLFRDEFYTAS